MPDPQAMFDITFFKSNPRPFFSLAKEICPGTYKPSVSHYFIRLLEVQNKLLRNYSQNVDTLEQLTGLSSSRLIQCHGSFATASCLRCRKRVPGDDIRDDILAEVCIAC